MRALSSVLLFGLAVAALQPSGAWAQTTETETGTALDQVDPMPRPNMRPGFDPSDDWRVTIGGGALYRPDYLGSDEYEVLPLPLFDLRYRDRFFLSTRDGLGANLLDNPNLRAGPVLKYRHRRDQDDNHALRGLGDVDAAGEAGGFVHYDLRPFSAGAEVRQGFGGHDGVVGDFFVAWSTLLGGRTRITAGPNLTLGSSDFTDTYFSISGSQAARSGLRAYDADGMFMSYGLGATVTYRLSDAWSVGGFAGIDRLAGDAADSPLVEDAGSATQARVGLSIGYSFGFGR
jgi:MipA family protein